MAKYYDGTFTGTVTSPGGAGSTTGVADTTTVGTAHAWTDLSGSHWFIDGSGNLAITGGTWNTDFLTRTDNHQDFSVWIYFDSLFSTSALATRASALAFAGRYQTGSSGSFPGTSTFYHIDVFGNTANGPANPSSLNYNMFGGTLYTLSGLDMNHRYVARVTVKGVSPTTITYQTYDLDGAGLDVTPIDTHSFTDSSHGPQTGGLFTLAPTLTGKASSVWVDRVIFDDTAPPSLTPGALSVSSYSISQISLALAADLGGTGPYSNAFQRSPTGANTWTTLVTHAGVTSTDSYTDSTVVSGTTYDYRVHVTDADSTTANSNVVTQQATYSPLVAGTPTTPPTCTRTTITLTATAATGGSGTSVCNWWRSQTYGFAVGDPGSAQVGTGLTYTDTPSGGEASVWLYIPHFVDATAAETADGITVIGSLFNRDFKLGFVGDSNTFLGFWSASATTAANTYFGLRTPVNGTGGGSQPNNVGVSGSNMTEWAQLDTPLGDSVTPRTHLTALQTNGCTHVMVMHGTNDASNSITPSSFKTSAQTVANEIIALGMVPIFTEAFAWVQQGQYAVSGGAAVGRTWATLGLLPQYAAQLRSLAAASNGTIFMSSAPIFAMTADHPEAFSGDGLHASGQVTVDVGVAAVAGALNALNYQPVPAGSGGGVFNVIGANFIK